MKAVFIVSQPRLDFRGVVVGRIVMNQEDLLATVAVSQTIKKCSVGLAIEHLFALDEIHAGLANIHRTKDLLGVALTGRGDKRLNPASSPSLIQRRILAEAGLVGEK
jgi:hypothetical protein